jgi:hypothetical protein
MWQNGFFQIICMGCQLCYFAHFFNTCMYVERDAFGAHYRKNAKIVFGCYEPSGASTFSSIRRNTLELWALHYACKFSDLFREHFGNDNLQLFHAKIFQRYFLLRLIVKSISQKILWLTAWGIPKKIFPYRMTVILSVCNMFSEYLIKCGLKRKAEI